MTYLLPKYTNPTSPFTLNQFIQSVLVGMTGLDGSLVRPRWQKNPPKQPNNEVNWIAYRAQSENPDTYAYVGMDANGVQNYARHEDLNIQCAFYGPDSMAYAGLVRDGFQITQNLEALNKAGMGFKDTGRIQLMPDLVNEQWVEKYELEIVLRRIIQATYAVQSIVSAGANVLTDSETPNLTVTINTEGT